MNHYFERMREDFATLGTDGNTVYPIYDYTGLHIFFETASVELSRQAAELNEIDETRLHTTLGRRALIMARSGVEFDDSLIDCCEEAEWRLVASLKNEAIENRNYASPLIITHNDLPAAIIKQNGQKSCYGLMDVPEHNLHAGCFHKTDAEEYLSELPPDANHAWEIPLDNATFQPVRFSLFATPRAQRKSLEANARNSELALSYSHTMLKQDAVKALAGARRAAQLIS